ncbi:MAG: J domain-containing protein, partial [Nostocaceae cyanobacterium]|nr:J domain-containing protein [Nostocaceae cyanobacterium]
MSFKIDRGLFKYDFTDHHAVLCVPVDADVKDIRKRYLKIARCLHPDSCGAANAEDKQRASQLLSKLVNPAYEKLSQDRTRAEYIVLLSQMGKRLVQESASIELKSDLARQLAGAPNVEHLYKTSLHKIAETQYASLDEVLSVIAVISELNMVYLIRTAGKTPTTAPSGGDKATAKASNAPASPPPPSAPPEESVAEQYIRRAQTLMTKNQFAPARIELQDALKLEPNNGRCHSMIGVVYYKQNQTTMAKVHFERALALNPQDEMALKGKRAIEAMGAKQSTSTTPASSATKPADKSSG